ncbi:pyridoxine 5'-phosphate synthase [Lutimonas vermicola]|uniref:Pyridoxine 5'-phosphate synthase n=1 Tax=Lutimonas vermicola TaxID=414288 RepID=A0ABU9L3A5_9FLAO
MTKLSVNINKIATLRNARGGNVPDLLKAAIDIQNFGAQGITIHPRPDQRHIRYIDAIQLRPVVNTEFNIEGNPIPEFIDLVLRIKPEQVTLVPDAVDAITSNAGWDTKTHGSFLKEVVEEFKRNGIRTSIFMDPVVSLIEGAAATGTDRIELYTESYAVEFEKGNKRGVLPYVKAAKKAGELSLGINAGHDLNLENLNYFVNEVPGVLEVSIGHALIAEALYFGLQNVVSMYLEKLK